MAGAVVFDTGPGATLKIRHPEERDARVYERLIVLPRRANADICEVTIVPNPSKRYPMAMSGGQALYPQPVLVGRDMTTSRFSQVRIRAIVGSSSLWSGQIALGIAGD